MDYPESMINCNLIGPNSSVGLQQQLLTHEDAPMATKMTAEQLMAVEKPSLMVVKHLGGRLTYGGQTMRPNILVANQLVEANQLIEVEQQTSLLATRRPPTRDEQPQLVEQLMATE